MEYLKFVGALIPGIAGLCVLIFKNDTMNALALFISVNAVFEFLTIAVNNYCLQSQIVLLGNGIGRLDRDRLRA